MHIRSQSTLESSINVTPLVDVCLVLLIIFMVIMPTIVNGVAVQLPHSKTAGSLSDSPQPLQITVKDDGTVYLGSIAVRREQVAGEVRRLHEQLPSRPVSVRGDRRVPYGDVIEVLDACRASGFSDVGLVSEKRE